MRHLLLVVMVALAASCSTSSPFDGVWMGKMVQPKGPLGSSGYVQFVELSVSGSRVEGTSRIEVRGRKYFGLMSLEGTVRGDSLYFRETAILEELPTPGRWWCLKDGVLAFQDSAATKLSGNWMSDTKDCTPGRIELRRIFR